MKDLYFRELDAKRDLDARPTLHVAVLSVLGSVLTYALVHFHADGEDGPARGSTGAGRVDKRYLTG